MASISISALTFCQMFHLPLAEITFGLLEVSSIELMFAGINMVFGLTQTHFGLSIQRGFK
jgi:hypothetical protein